jgi:hypothetical protein
MPPVQEYQEDLKAIRNIMERSRIFVSLSGWSGILAGSYAILGAVAARATLLRHPGHYLEAIHENGLALLGIAASVLAASLATFYLQSRKKATQAGEPLFTPAFYRVLVAMLPPLVAGGALCFILWSRGFGGFIAPVMLLFYGMALHSVGNHTYSDIRQLGWIEMALGLLCALMPGKGLVFWTLGFGLMHIIYGAIMLKKYERRPSH